MSMVDSERVRDLLTRAGLAGVSPAAVRWLLLACVVLIGLTVWRFWPAAPAPEIEFVPDDVSGGAPVVEAVPASCVDAVPEAVIVHVAGAVMRPGVYELPVGARVADALDAAGGARDSAAPDAVNLARILTDGERVHIPTTDEVAAGVAGDAASGGGASGPGAAATSSDGGVVDINTASAADLEQLPGVGPATAQKIVDDREKNGPFAAPEDLMRVPGIGPKKFEAMKDLVSCG